jgi:hypothetical protein
MLSGLFRQTRRKEGCPDYDEDQIEEEQEEETGELNEETANNVFYMLLL